MIGDVASTLPIPAGPVEFSPDVLAIADALPMMIGYLDREERYRFINRALADWFELPRRDDARPDHARGAGREIYASPPADGRGGAWPESGSGLQRISTIRPAGCWRSRPITSRKRMPAAKVVGMILVVQDVTEQRAAERALKESEARFRRIADSAPAMMWVTRLDRTRDFVNDAYAEFAGLSREEARLLDWRERIHPDDQERLVAESIAGEASLKPFTLEARYLRKDGEWRWLRSVSQPRFGADGSLSGLHRRR